MDNIQGLLEIEIVRRKFKEWINLEIIKREIKKSLTESRTEDFLSSFILYVSIAFEIPIEELENVFWFDMALSYEKALRINEPKIKVPMLLYRNTPDEIKEVQYNFEYSEREWFVMLHTFLKAYKWSIKEVEELDVDDALPLLQEIRIQDQLDKEFTYSLSEVAYPYDEGRKLHVFKPLERPEWMKEYIKVLPPKKAKIRKDMLPVGLIIRSPNAES